MFSHELVVGMRMFVCRVVVDDQVKVESGRCFSIDLVEEADPFLVAMARHALTDDAPFEHIQRGEKSGRSVALVVVSHRPAPPLLDRKTGLGAVESLNL